ncbi:MAG TPA: DUF4159 domain-containing protein [Gammaproteobacteria bacterium]|nr:DUF4159 domain-containing protein [Gammaproteobacteria bacterium]
MRITRVPAAPLLLTAGLLAGAPALTAAQPSDDDESASESEGEFYFARLAYSDALGFGRRYRGAWLTDYPEAETHLLEGLGRLTRLALGPEGVGVDLSSDEIMNYPFIYAVEVGHWQLGEQEAARLREYLLRGGFLVVDDFWGTYEWSVFLDSIQRVFPDRSIVELEDDNEVLHVLYQLKRDVQIPGVSYVYTGQTWQRDGRVPHWRGIYDDDGRLMVAINFNMDLGDAWEHADNPAYPEPMTTLAYRFAINYIIYAMTH